MNLSGTVNALRILYNPSLFLPHLTISTFKDLPVPLKFPGAGPEIKVVLLDKDNCFAAPHASEVWPAYQDVFAKLRAAYPGDRLMIVSNTAGSSSDRDGAQARVLGAATGVKVFEHHGSKKPGCHGEVLRYLKEETGLVQDAAEVAVVGDRLMTDVALAGMMGARAVWIRDGVVPSRGVFSLFEKTFYDYMTKSK